jgi:hypothetical protein
MRRSLTLLASCVLATSAAAQGQAAPERVLVPASRPAATPYFIWPDDLADYKVRSE